MKTERRHELKKNELADALGKEIEFIRPYWKFIVGGVVLALAAVVAWMAISHNNFSQRQAAWTPVIAKQARIEPGGSGQLSDRSSKAVAELQKLGEEKKGTPAGAAALLLAAQAKAQSGMNKVFSNRKEADADLSAAAEQFQAAADAFRDPEFKQRALLGLAYSKEGLRDPEAAKTAYENVKKVDPKSALAQLADKRIERLTKETAEWYAWFSEQTPRSPHDFGPGGELPQIPLDPKFLTPPGPKSSGDPASALDNLKILPDKKGDAASPDKPKPPEKPADPAPPSQPKSEPKPEPKAEPKPEPKPEAKPEPKVEPKSEPKSEAKPEPKSEPKAEPKPEAKPEPKVEPAGDKKPVSAPETPPAK